MINKKASVYVKRIVEENYTEQKAVKKDPIYRIAALQKLGYFLFSQLFGKVAKLILN